MSTQAVQTSPAAPTPAQPTQPAAPEKRRATIDLLEIIAESEFKQQYAKELISAEVARDAFDQDWRLARIFAMSGVFSDIPNVSEDAGIATAMAKIQLGRSWGLTPGDSMQFVFFTNGKPAVMNEIVASKMRQAGYDWDIDWREEEVKENGKTWMKCTGCTLWLKKWDAKAGKFMPVVDRQGKPVSQSFTSQDADHAMIWEKGKQIPLSSKWNFQSWPRDMYFWRCIARLKRYHATDVLCGASTRDEAEEAAPTDLPAVIRSTEAAEEVGRRKLSAMSGREVSIEEFRRGTTETETAEERDARLERQSQEQLLAAKAREEKKITQADVDAELAKKNGGGDRSLTDDENRALDAKIAADEGNEPQLKSAPRTRRVSL